MAVSTRPKHRDRSAARSSPSLRVGRDNSTSRACGSSGGGERLVAGGQRVGEGGVEAGVQAVNDPLFVFHAPSMGRSDTESKA